MRDQSKTAMLANGYSDSNHSLLALKSTTIALIRSFASSSTVSANEKPVKSSPALSPTVSSKKDFSKSNHEPKMITAISETSMQCIVAARILGTIHTFDCIDSSIPRLKIKVGTKHHYFLGVSKVVVESQTKHIVDWELKQCARCKSSGRMHEGLHGFSDCPHHTSSLDNLRSLQMIGFTTTPLQLSPCRRSST